MSTYFQFTESSSQDMTSQDSKPTDIYGEGNEYYEDEAEDATNLEGDEEEEGDAWDDSALIAAWDVAVKEYQDFHSINANKTDTRSDTTFKKTPTSSNNKVIETEKLVNIIKEDEIESFVQQDISSALNENEGTSDFVMKTSVKEQKQNVQKLPEQKIKETKQIKPQTATRSTSVLTRDTSYQPQPIKTTASFSSYSHHFPGYYSYPPPSSSTAPIPPHSFGEQIKGTTDTQEDQDESQLPPTEEATTSYSNNTNSNTNNVHDPYYNYNYGWYSNYYPPPPPPPPGPQFYPPNPSSMPTDSNIPFPGWRPKPPDMAPPMSGSDDEAFTNLIMAWYYSGYYTGLYHGRKGR